MADTVFVFGAGINQGIQDEYGLRPPLSKNFFQLALQHNRIGNEHYYSKALYFEI